MSPRVTVMALVDHESLAELLGVELVSRQQVDHLDLAFLAASQNAGDVTAALAWHQAEIETSNP